MELVDLFRINSTLEMKIACPKGAGATGKPLPPPQRRILCTEYIAACIIHAKLGREEEVE